MAFWELVILCFLFCISFHFPTNLRLALFSCGGTTSRLSFYVIKGYDDLNVQAIKICINKRCQQRLGIQDDELILYGNQIWGHDRAHAIVLSSSQQCTSAHLILLLANLSINDLFFIIKHVSYYFIYFYYGDQGGGVKFRVPLWYIKF